MNKRKFPRDRGVVQSSLVYRLAGVMAQLSTFALLQSRPDCRKHFDGI
jgi:hypothetical protein